MVLYGDSITEQNYYNQFVELYTVDAVSCNAGEFFGAGVGGDRVTGGGAGPIDQRLARDVFPLEPTVMSIMLGMNDGGYHPLTDATKAHTPRATIICSIRCERTCPVCASR